MKVNKIISMLFLSLLSMGSISSQINLEDNVCSESNTNFVFFNGVFTTEDKAKDYLGLL